MKRRQEAAEEEERQRRQAEADAKAAQEAQVEAARRAELSARDSHDAPGSPGSNRDEAGKSSIVSSRTSAAHRPFFLLFHFDYGFISQNEYLLLILIININASSSWWGPIGILWKITFSSMIALLTANNFTRRSFLSWWTSVHNSAHITDLIFDHDFFSRCALIC